MQQVKIYMVGLLLALSLASSGCSSIHSSAVRKLIDKQGQKLAEAAQNSKDFVTAAGEQAQNLRKVEAELDLALQELRTEEQVHSVIFSANQNLQGKQGVDAHAAAYLIGMIYLADHMGLEKTVRDQFASDFAALGAQSQRVADSWEALGKLQEALADYAKKSGLAAVDPDFIAGVLGQIPHAFDELETVLKDGRKVNEAIEKAMQEGPLQSTAAQAQPYVSQLLDLLERVKASRP
jgi:hypothetical protein